MGVDKDESFLGCETVTLCDVSKSSLSLYLQIQVAAGIHGLPDRTGENTEILRFFEKYSPNDIESYPRIKPESSDNQFLLSRPYRYCKYNVTRKSANVSGIPQLVILLYTSITVQMANIAKYLV